MGGLLKMQLVYLMLYILWPSTFTQNRPAKESPKKVQIVHKEVKLIGMFVLYFIYLELN